MIGKSIILLTAATKANLAKQESKVFGGFDFNNLYLSSILADLDNLFKPKWLQNEVDFRLNRKAKVMVNMTRQRGS